MFSQARHFPVFILVSLIVFCAILYYVLHHRTRRSPLAAVFAVAIVVVMGGMLFAKFGAMADWPWWIYYPVPALVTLLLPPIAFRLRGTELWQYLVLAFLSAPFIHVAFSFFLGWHEYMPFIPVPSLHQLLAGAATRSG